jgi:group I intron endonuclease
MIIYCARNLTNDKLYVGKTTKTLEERKLQHYDDANNGSETHFHRALCLDNEFEWSVLEHVIDVSRLNERECFWITKLNTYVDGYNMTIGGDGGITYRKGDELYDRIKHKLGHSGDSNPGANTEIHARAAQTYVNKAKVGEYHPTGDLHGNFKGVLYKRHAKYKGNASSATAKPVYINGIEYPSCSAASRVLGITPETVSNRCKKSNYIGWEFV